MLNLSQTEYLPTLAKGYQWKWHLENDSSESICIRIVYTGVFSDVNEVKRGWVKLEEGLTDEAIRARVLNKTREMMGTFRPWNTVGADQVKRAMDSLTPPKDSEYPLGEDGPRLSREMRVTKAQF